MADTWNALIEDCLVVQTRLPFAWVPGGVLEGSRQDACVRQLELLYGFEDARAELVDEINGSTQESVLQRMESKLDFAMEMLGSLVMMQRPPPASLAMDLCSSGLRLHACDAFKPGSGLVRLHLNAMVPEALQIDARMHQDSERGPVFMFENQSAQLKSLIERAIFKIHRRSIAAARKG